MSDLPSLEWLEKALRLSLKSGDMVGVDAALRLIAVQDPGRAQTLVDTLQLGVALGGSS